MKLLTTLLLLYSSHFCVSLEFRNNACRKYEDYRFWFWSKDCYYNPDVFADPAEVIKRNGFNFEGYTVSTEDNYLLTLFRIPPEKNDYRQQKQPIFIQHGLLTNSAIWVTNGNNSLGLYLANLGYDVWLGNIRGSKYSRGHKYFKITDPQYWNFNLDHIAKYDISAKINFIASKTGKGGTIIYLGHSMGTTLSFMYASSKIESHNLLKGIIAMAPTAYFNNVSAVEKFEFAVPSLQKVFDRHQIKGLLYQNSVRYVTNNFCRLNALLCKRIIETTFGNLTEQFLPENLLLFFSNFPCATSLGQLLHYRQLAKTGKFTTFDYGNGKKVAFYNLRKIKMPVYLLYGKNDILSTELNVRKLFEELGSRNKLMEAIPISNTQHAFNHLNFIIAKDIVKLLYEDLVKILNDLKP